MKISSLKMVKTIFRSTLVTFLTLSLVTNTMAADYQWSVHIAGNDKESRAFLWIPPDCKQVRGLVFGSQVILEKLVCDNPIVREACAREGLGIVIVFRSPLTFFKYNEGADSILQKILNDLAEESGYAEVAKAPLLTIGHSGGAIGAWNIAYWNPERTIGILTLHSAAMITPPAWDNKSSVDGIPVMAVSGELESWDGPKYPLERHWRWLRGELLSMRGRYYDSRVCEVVQPGAGHFNFDEHLAKLSAMFIQKVAHYRIPETLNYSQPIVLNLIPAENGWLTDINILTPSKFPPTQSKKFKGDPSLAFWHMDKEIANAVEAFPALYGGKTDQRVTFVQDGKPVPAGWIAELKFQPSDDGISFKLQGDFLSQTPDGASGGGQPLGHANSPIKFSLIGGWGGGGEQVDNSIFCIRFDHFGLSRYCCNIQVMVYNEGDGTYKYAEQAGQVKFPEKYNDGKSQAITFPSITDVKVGTKSVQLKAVSDAGLPVSYFVRSGPVEINGDKMVFTSIPVRAKFPIKVTVVAYQLGRSLEPLVQTAIPVEQTFLIQLPIAP
jgi:hypothetical protein